MMAKRADALRKRAAELRRVADAQSDEPMRRTLLAVADEFESLIDEMVEILKNEDRS